MPRCLIVQHVEAERPFGIGTALQDAGVAIDIRCVFADDPLPTDLADHQGLVVMGGPMSADSDEGFPSRVAELGLLRDAVERDLPVLGVCLGAQLLALAAGGAVRRGESGVEIGWGPVTLTEDGQKDPLFRGCPTSFDVLHWHGDTFDVPENGLVLASNGAYAAQAVRIGDTAWALQFHVEVDQGAVESFLRSFGQEAERVGGGVARIRQRTPAALEVLASARRLLLARFAQLVAHSEPR